MLILSLASFVILMILFTHQPKNIVVIHSSKDKK